MLCSRSGLTTRPVPKGDSRCCANSSSVTVSFPGRACHPYIRKGMAMTIVRFDRARWWVVSIRISTFMSPRSSTRSAGCLLSKSFPVNPAGYAALSSWMAGFGALQRVGIEGTGSYGAGLSRHFGVDGVEVIEVDRPNRQERRRNGKSDELDAIEAARAALSGRARGPRRIVAAMSKRSGCCWSRNAPRVSTRIASIVQLRHVMFTAPDDLRVRFRDCGLKHWCERRPGCDPSPERTWSRTQRRQRR